VGGEIQSDTGKKGDFFQQNILKVVLFFKKITKITFCAVRENFRILPLNTAACRFLPSPLNSFSFLKNTLFKLIRF
jgi:hypothetical protein